jgi:hypothetical protein
MNKPPFLLILSCQKNVQQRAVIKQCLTKKNADFLIVTGGDKLIQTDNEVQLPVDDSYELLHLKLVAAIEYVAKLKTDIIKLDDDSFIDTNKLLTTKFDYDYGGFLMDNSMAPYHYHMNRVSTEFAKPIVDKTTYNFAFGGGYFLSKKAQKLFLENYKHTDEYSYHLNGLKGREDRLVGKTLYKFKDKLKIHNGGYWISDKIFSTLNDCVFHSIPLDYLSLLYSKQLPKYHIFNLSKDMTLNCKNV